MGWIAWLQLIWVTYTQLEILAVITALLVVENYYVNVKVRRYGCEDANPFWRFIELRLKLNFTYAYPAIAALAFALLYFGQTNLLLPRMFMIVANLAGALPLATICAVNDGLIYYAEKTKP